MRKQVSKEAELQFLSFRKGEEKGFAYFFHLFYSRVRFFASRLLDDRPEADDITEEAFIKLWRRHERFEGVDAVRNFLYLVVRNACFDFLRQDKRETSRNEAFSRLTGTTENFILEEMIRSEVMGEVQEAINNLPMQCKRIFHLYVEGKSYAEIAAELHLSVSTIRNQKARALQLIRQQLVVLSVLISCFFLNFLK